MRYYLLDPEVPGELGAETVLDRTVHPPKVFKLHLVLDAWLGDDLVQCFPSYLGTARLRVRSETEHLSGVRFAPIHLTFSESFDRRGPKPKFWWLQIDGAPGKHDIGLTDDARLVLSERAYQSFETLQLKHCPVALFSEAE